MNSSEIQLVGPRWSERLTKHTSSGALRTSCVTSPSPVFCTGHVSFLSLIVCDFWLLNVEKKVTLLFVVAELGFLTVVQRSDCLFFYYLS